MWVTVSPSAPQYWPYKSNRFSPVELLVLVLITDLEIFRLELAILEVGTCYKDESTRKNLKRLSQHDHSK